MAHFFARTARFIAALILLCGYAASACTQAEVMPTVQPTLSLPSLVSSETPLPTNAPTETPETPGFKGPLSVIITQPPDNETVKVSPVEITGQADPDTVVTINDAIVLVDSSGSFKMQLPLETGANLIEITASDANDHQGYAYLTLFYDSEP